MITQQQMDSSNKHGNNSTVSDLEEGGQKKNDGRAP
jgi:hypothetical protein